MKQKNIRTTAGALDGLTKAIGGATQHGVAIGIKQHDASSLTAKKTSLTNAESTLDAAKAELKTRTTALASFLLTAILFLMRVRDMLKPHLGTQHSTAWAAVGFLSSLELPSNLEQVKFKLQKAITFLTANPTFESADQNLTAEAAQTILDNIIIKENAVTAQRTVVGNAVKAKNTSLRNAIRAIGGLVSEMKGLVPSTDSIYLAFGLNIPGAQAIPSVPINLTAALLNAAALLKWDAAERAERYRIYKKVIGVDADFVLVDSREELDYMLEALPANATIQLAVSAMNNGGESALSEAVTIVTA